MPSEERWKEIMEDREKTVLELLEEASEILCNVVQESPTSRVTGPVGVAQTKVDFAIFKLEDAADALEKIVKADDAAKAEADRDGSQW